jgi:glycosyltransferase involved in cell wall biosynthesis
MELQGIGLFNECYLPILDGVSLTVKNYALWLNRKIAPTIVVTPTFPDYIDNEEFKVIRYFSGPLPVRKPYRYGLPFLDLNICNNLLKIPLGIIHSHSPFSAGSLALKIARKKGIPIVATFHSKFRDDLEVHFSHKFVVDYLISNIISIYEAADEVWIPQAKVEDTIRSYGYKGSLEVVENGIDLYPPTDINIFRNESRHLLGYNPDEFLLLYVGQHIWEKNLKFLIESLRLSPIPKFTALFVGDGFAKPYLEKLVIEYGLSDKIKFLGVVSDREHLKRIYASADLLLLPSLYDTFSLVIREAASFHTPTLIIKDSYVAEFVQDGVNGYLSENSESAFMQKIGELLKKKAELTTIGKNASLTLCRSWENVVDEVQDRYSNLIKRKSKQAHY